VECRYRWLLGCFPMALFWGARGGSKTLRHITEKIRCFRGGAPVCPSSAGYVMMTSSCDVKLANALNAGTRAKHTRVRSFSVPVHRGLRSGRPTVATHVPVPVPGSRSLWTGASRASALDAARRLTCNVGDTWGLAARSTNPGSLSHQTRGMKIKIKPYSSWKRRFQITKSGLFKRKQKGKRHKAFSKSPAQRMRLRGDRLVHESLVKPMRKLGFKLR
jgi:ribosomal protein L35